MNIKKAWKLFWDILQTVVAIAVFIKVLTLSGTKIPGFGYFPIGIILGLAVAGISLPVISGINLFLDWLVYKTTGIELDNNLFFVKQKLINILYVEDEPIINEMVTEVLENSGKFKVYSLPDTRTAYDILEKYAIDLIMTGIMLPHQGGLGFLKEIKQNTQYKNIPYVIFSNLDSEKIMQDAYANGAIAYYNKTILPPSMLLNNLLALFNS